MPSADTQYLADTIGAWLKQISEFTQATRDAVMKPPPPPQTPPAPRWERAMDALSERFESMASQWRKTPVEQLIASGLDASSRRMEGAISSALANARSLANRGMSGTVEQAQRDFALDQLGRQFAAVMSPIFNGMTYFANQIEQRMRMMNGGEQNRLLGLGVGAYVGSRLGPMGAIAGGLAGSALGGSGDSYDSLRGGAAGAYLGFRVGGPVGAALGYGVGSVAMSGDYGRLRGEGNSKFASTIGAGIGSLTDIGYNVFGPRGLGLGSGPNPMDAIRKEADVGSGRIRPSEPRRDVTPYNPNMLDTGGNFFEIQKAVTRATAGDNFKEDGGPMKDVVDGIIKIIELLAKIAGVTLDSAPPPSGARR